MYHIYIYVIKAKSINRKVLGCCRQGRANHLHEPRCHGPAAGAGEVFQAHGPRWAARGRWRTAAVLLGGGALERCALAPLLPFVGGLESYLLGHMA